MSGLPKSGRGRGARPLVVGAATLGACLAAGPAAAQAFWEGFTLPPSTWSVFGGVTHTTNAARVAGGDGDTIGSVGVSGSFFRDQGRLTASVVGSVAYEEYFQDTFDGDVRASLGAQARYQLVPERVSWSVDNTFGQVATNAFAPSTPGFGVGSRISSSRRSANSESACVSAVTALQSNWRSANSTVRVACPAARARARSSSAHSPAISGSPPAISQTGGSPRSKARARVSGTSCIPRLSALARAAARPAGRSPDVM